MTGVCTKCGVAYETTEEDASAQGRVCPTCHWAPEAVRLIDTYGEWVSQSYEESRAWWAKVGYPDAPAKPHLHGLVGAVKRECARRDLAADPRDGVPHIHVRPKSD